MAGGRCHGGATVASRGTFSARTAPADEGILAHDRPETACLALLLTTALPAAALAQDAPSAGTIPGSPNLAVATVKMENGYRASKLIGAAVFNDQNQQVGSVDDLILTKEDKAALAVISVGGFLGVGAKLVAVPYGDLHVDDKGKVLLPNASKEDLDKKPNFTYAG